jgi:hypothetical protein
MDNSYVGIASEKAHLVNITLARTVQMSATQSHQWCPARYNRLNSVDNWPGIANAIAEHRCKKLFGFLRSNGAVR